MLLQVPRVLDDGELARVRETLAGASWSDGRATSGVQSAQAKNNEQLALGLPQLRELQELVLGALNRHPMFFSAALPRRVYPPMFNRYSGGTNEFGNHIDNAIRTIPGGAGGRVRTDISCTLFLADPGEYDGGELVIEDTYGAQRIKLPAGDMVIYPGTSVHQVSPVTRGHRMACFFWVESMVRSPEQRQLLFDMDMALLRLRQSVGETDPAVITLSGTYHNLLRMWSDV